MGHAILDSCHNCGARGVTLYVVSLVTDCKAETYPHVHIIVACEQCKLNIWDKE